MNYTASLLARIHILEIAIQGLRQENEQLLELLRESIYFLEFIPIGMSDKEVPRFHKLMEDLYLEIGVEHDPR